METLNRRHRFAKLRNHSECWLCWLQLQNLDGLMKDFSGPQFLVGTEYFVLIACTNRTNLIAVFLK